MTPSLRKTHFVLWFILTILVLLLLTFAFQ